MVFLELEGSIIEYKAQAARDHAEKAQLRTRLDETLVARATLEGSYKVLRELLEQTRESAKDSTELLFEQLRSGGGTSKKSEKKKKKIASSPEVVHDY